MKKNAETKKAVNFGQLAEAFNRARKNPNDSDAVKKWEKIFDEKWAEPINTIPSTVEYISAWLCYVPPSRRPVLLHRLLSGAITPKALHDCLAGTTGWEKKEKEELEKAWQEASKRFCLDNESFLLKNEALVALANNIFYLAPPWQAEATAGVSRLIVTKKHNDNVKELYLAITTPGDLSDNACRRFLDIAKNQEEAASMISKLSLVNQADPPEKLQLQNVSADRTRQERILALWEELKLAKFLKTRTLAVAEKIINNFAPDDQHLDILKDARACLHLTRFINSHQTGKKIYKMIIAIHGNENLLAVPAMSAWALSLSLILKMTNQYLSNEELGELYKIVTGKVKNEIAEVYFGRVKKEWFDNPL
ncbi:MAG: hypothetical protein NTY31_03810 [Candidatus Falkowbacteria bacterium]|nr:hypothetical protein [Candidatus Falkowbacteria bacterium]